MQKNFSTSQLRPFRDRDVVWYTPFLPFLCGGFVYLMILLSGRIEALLNLPESYIPHTTVFVISENLPAPASDASPGAYTEGVCEYEDSDHYNDRLPKQVDPGLLGRLLDLPPFLAQ